MGDTMAQFNKDLSNWEHSQSLVLNMLEAHTSKIDDLTKKVFDTQKDIEVIRTLVAGNSDDTKTLLKLVRDGNGTSLISKVQDIERDIDQLQLVNQKHEEESKTKMLSQKQFLIAMAIMICTSLYNVLQGQLFK